jgi:hypothetical protein
MSSADDAPAPLDLPQPPPRPAPAAALPELVANVRHWLSQPGDEDVAIFDVAEAVQAALRTVWLKAAGTTAERFAIALQAATELLEGLGLALAEGTGPGEK